MIVEDTQVTSLMERVELGGESYFKITDSHKLRPFFMSVVSASNHWLFISSNGGITAGRKNAEFSLFPYYTDDKITESADITGSKTIIRLHKDGRDVIWEPYSVRQKGLYATSQNLYKSEYGNKIIFEEVNHDLGLTVQYRWATSNNYGFVRTTAIINDSDSAVECHVLDGVQNIVPAGVGSYLQNNTSNLVDAYKRSEIEPNSKLGIFALSAVIVDKAEPSEALKANTAWHTGIDPETVLLSSMQLDAYRAGQVLNSESDIKAEKGAYFIGTPLTLAAGQNKIWHIIANVNQSQSDVVRISQEISNDDSLPERVLADVELGSETLIKLNASADGLQLTADDRRDARHFSNVLFNIMRGGIFDNNYTVERWDLIKHVKTCNKKLADRYADKLSGLAENLSLQELQELADEIGDPDFTRIATEYLPLKFSRRHGDPSRPWNKFSINTHSEIDGSKILDYEGNWRDIFQNWEALAHAYPAFIEGMIFKFLNASTFDGYNPYRVTRDGFDWEISEPDDPWSYIGYWGDHQIIYLLKFLEFSEKHYPGKLAELFDKDVFVYANVPYRIKPIEDIISNPKDTIDFDEKADHAIREQRDQEGADGALWKTSSGDLHRVNFTEKILATLLAKMSNLVPEGGIWMNTQRPEWNDANNALVGNGMSMVTLYYMHRFVKFYQETLSNSDMSVVSISSELAEFFTSLHNTLVDHKGLLDGGFTDTDRATVLDGIAKAACDFRCSVYSNGFSGARTEISVEQLTGFTELCNDYLRQSISANKREDNLYHAYNILNIDSKESMNVSYLDEMLEGQVAALSAKYLSPAQVVSVLDSMRTSKIYRPDQNSYLLYPNKELKGFLSKNVVSEDKVNKSKLLSKLVEDGNTQIIERDVLGEYHFNAGFRNAEYLKEGLNSLASGRYESMIAQDKEYVLDLYEEIFNHKAFTGRSSTFFGYEGLGSIYWHMVSKLLLAVQECCFDAINAGESKDVINQLITHYHQINDGIGVHKTPGVYGAFPTDPYSHTPGGKGAQQPGMTGQVKEDILARFGELGVVVEKGQLHFMPLLLKQKSFLDEPAVFEYVDLDNTIQKLNLKPQSLVFTYAQVPVMYTIAAEQKIKIVYNSGEEKFLEGHTLTIADSEAIFHRTREIVRLEVSVASSTLFN